MKKLVCFLWEKIRADPLLSGLIGLLGGLFIIFLIVVFCDNLQWIYPRLGLEPKSEKKYEALKFLGIGMGGLLIAIQAVMSYKRAKALEDTVKNTEQGQRQERLKNAIEHLGNASNSVRLGGAYELFHLAEDTEDRGQRQTVLDILCAHIRWTTREGKYRGHSGGDEIEYKDKYPSNPSEEIQSLLALLFVQEHKVFTECDINLEGSWLNGSNLDKAHLEKANLRGAQLHEAHLSGALLHGADLSGAQLHEAHLSGALLHGADLSGAQLHEAHLSGAQLHGADLSGAQLHGAHLSGALLHEADLSGALLHGASCDDLEYPYEPFETVINERIGEESDLSGVISAGGLTLEDLASIGKGLPDEDAKKLREKLKAHIGKPESRDLPERRGAIRGKYTYEEARQWIAEYKTATSVMSESG